MVTNATATHYLPLSRCPRNSVRWPLSLLTATEPFLGARGCWTQPSGSTSGFCGLWGPRAHHLTDNQYTTTCRHCLVLCRKSSVWPGLSASLLLCLFSCSGTLDTCKGLCRGYRKCWLLFDPRSTVGYAHISHCWPVPLVIRGIQGFCFIKNHIQKPCFTVHSKPSQICPNWVRTLCLLLHIPLPFLLSPGIDGMLCRGTGALEMHNHTAYSAANMRLVII